MSGPQIFRVPLSLVEGRLDPLYYFSVNNLALTKKTKYPVKRLADVIDMQRGRFGHRPRNDPRFYDGAYPFIQTGDVVQASSTDGRISYSQTLNELGLKTSRLFDKPVVVLTIAANIGDTAILDYPACFPDSLIGMSPKSAEISLEYINLYFKFIKEYLNNLAPQSAQKNINYQQLAPVPIVVPPIHVQKAATEIYKNALIQKAKNDQQAQALLSSVDRVLYQHLGIEPLKYDADTVEERIFKVPLSLIAGQIFDPKSHRPRSIALFELLANSRFTQCRLSDLVTHRSAGDWGEDEDQIAEGYKRCLVIRGTDFDNEFNLRVDKTRSKYRQISIIKLRRMRVSEGDILVEKSGGSVDQPVGRVALLDQSLLISETVAYSNFVEKLKVDYQQVIPEYLHCYLRFVHSIGVTDLLQSQTNGIRNLMLKRYLKLPVSVPPKQVQIDLVDQVQALHNQALTLRNQAQNCLDQARQQVEKMILGEAQ